MPAAQDPASPFSSPAEREVLRARKREAVLRAAVRMFNARGFHATSLEEVAASLGISKPTIYHYLGTKEAVLLEGLTRSLGQLREACAQARGAGSGIEGVRAFLRRYGRVIMDEFDRCVIRTPEEVLSAEGARRIRALKAEIDAMLRALIDEGKADGSIAPVDTRLAAFTMAGALNWTARWHDPAGPLTPDAIADAIVDLLIAGIAPRAG